MAYGGIQGARDATSTANTAATATTAAGATATTGFCHFVLFTRAIKYLCRSPENIKAVHYGKGALLRKTGVYTGPVG